MRAVPQTGTRESGRARIPRTSLRNLRPDLTVPEVRSNREWRLFESMSCVGIPWNSAEGQWAPYLMREVDMTKGRPLFLSAPQPSSVPVVEGRMIQQHRFGAQRYVEAAGDQQSGELTL